MTITFPPLEEVAVRPAEPKDRASLSTFLNFQPYVHRHLDWKNPLDWLGEQPFLIAEYRRTILSVLACPADPPHVAWLRLFASSYTLPVEATWKLLLEQALAYYAGRGGLTVAGLALQNWFADLMIASGFETRQSIVVLEWNGALPELRPLPHGLEIRAINEVDLPAVAEVDARSFEPLWHNSLDSLTHALGQSAIGTLAVLDGQIVGYQISTSFPFGGHLARLAVLPECQGLNIGFGLVHDLLRAFKKQGAWRVTVNTQNNNSASLGLYQKLGFTRTGEEFAVYTYPPV